MHFGIDIRFLKPYPMYNTQVTFKITTENVLINMLKSYIYPENLCVQQRTLTYLHGWFFTQKPEQPSEAF